MTVSKTSITLYLAFSCKDYIGFVYFTSEVEWIAYKQAMSGNRSIWKLK